MKKGRFVPSPTLDRDPERVWLEGLSSLLAMEQLRTLRGDEVRFHRLLPGFHWLAEEWEARRLRARAGYLAVVTDLTERRVWESLAMDPSE